MIPVAKPILSGDQLDEIRAVLESGILAQGETGLERPPGGVDRYPEVFW